MNTTLPRASFLNRWLGHFDRVQIVEMQAGSRSRTDEASGETGIETLLTPWLIGEPEWPNSEHKAAGDSEWYPMSLMSVATIVGVAPDHLYNLYFKPNVRLKPAPPATGPQTPTTPVAGLGSGAEVRLCQTNQ